MKWKAKTSTNPQFGDKLIQKEFAFLPTRVGEHWVWLEPYYEMYVYRWSRNGLGGETMGYFATYPYPTRAMFKEPLTYKLDTVE